MKLPSTYSHGTPAERRQRYLQRWGALQNERASWWDHWAEIARYHHPRKWRSAPSDGNQGTKRNDAIINNTQVYAVRTLAAGMMSGITSPSRPWFQLTVEDPALAQDGEVRLWLDEVVRRMRAIFDGSNFYNALQQVYALLPTIGTAPVFVDEDAEDVVRLYVLAPGSYALANSARLAVDSAYRTTRMTAAQLKEAFGEDNVSDAVRAACKDGRYDEWHEVLHVVEPAPEGSREAKRGFAFRSVWMEVGDGKGSGEQLGFLRESGYHEDPFACPRWDVTGEDVYGTPPAMDALGDVKALQAYEVAKAKLVQKLADPPMTGPVSLAAGHASLLPGSYTPVDARGAHDTYRPAMEVNPAGIQVVAEELRQHEERIKRTYYADLWLMMASSSDGDRTAREVAERHEEKMLQLGPVLERLHDELLEPLIRRTYAIALRRGLLPEVPEALQGQQLTVQYVSIMAQAQKLLGISAVERGVAFVGSLVGVFPEAADNVDPDEVVRLYFDALGTPAKALRSAKDVEARRQERARQQAEAAAMEQAQGAAQAAETLSRADMEGDSALSRLTNALGVPVGPGVEA